jgi:hypothetical protein
MDKKTPQQLDLSFEACTAQLLQQRSHTSESSIAAFVPQEPAVPSEFRNSSAVVFNFQTAVSRREEATRTGLYRQILDSVRHIG